MHGRYDVSGLHLLLIAIPAVPFGDIMPPYICHFRGNVGGQELYKLYSYFL